MSQSPSLSDAGIGPYQCLVRKAEAEQDDPQIPLCDDLGVASGLRAKRMMGIWIVQRKSRLQMRSGYSKPTAEHVTCTAGLVS